MPGSSSVVPPVAGAVGEGLTPLGELGVPGLGAAEDVSVDVLELVSPESEDAQPVSTPVAANIAQVRTSSAPKRRGCLNIHQPYHGPSAPTKPVLFIAITLSLSCSERMTDEAEPFRREHRTPSPLTPLRTSVQGNHLHALTTFSSRAAARSGLAAFAKARRCLVGAGSLAFGSSLKNSSPLVHHLRRSPETTWNRCAASRYVRRVRSAGGSCQSGDFRGATRAQAGRVGSFHSFGSRHKTSDNLAPPNTEPEVRRSRRRHGCNCAKTPRVSLQNLNLGDTT